jgi:hypothetical protein
LDQKGTNTAWILTAPGYNRHHAFCAKLDIDNDNFAPDLAYDANIITDAENKFESEEEVQEDNESTIPDSPVGRKERSLVYGYLNGPKDAPSPTVIVDKEDTMPQDALAMFLRWHHQLGHFSPKKIRLLAKLGCLPLAKLGCLLPALANCHIPLCTSCLFGKATRDDHGELKQETEPQKLIQLQDPAIAFLLISLSLQHQA